MNREEHTRHIADAMTEQELEDAIVDLLDVYKYWYHHDLPAYDKGQTERPYVHVRGQNGFPDWLAVGSRVLLFELKKERGKLRPEQREWIGRLRQAGAEVYVWRPTDWLDGTIGEILLGAKP